VLRPPVPAVVNKSRVDAGVDLFPDLVQERLDDRFLVVGPELAVCLGRCADLVARK
jgi:hypothetical protein